MLGSSRQALLRSANTSGIVAGETLGHGPASTCCTCRTRPAPALQDVLAGRVSMMFTDLTTGLPHVRSGTLRALAVTRLQRSPLFPELPSLDEAGVMVSTWIPGRASSRRPIPRPRSWRSLTPGLRKIIDDADSSRSSAKWASKRSQARPRSSEISSRSSSASGSRWSASPASGRNRSAGFEEGSS